MKIKVYMHYLKMVDYMKHQPVVVTTAFPNEYDIETFIDINKVYIKKQGDRLLIKRKRFRDKLKFWKKSSFDI